MTNEELKKKICDIIAPYVSAYGDDERIADALIAAGLTFEPMTFRIVENKPYSYTAGELANWKEDQDRIAKLLHRAIRAERALLAACIKMVKDFEANEEHTEWGMYRNKELEKLEAENAELKARLRIIKMALEYSCLETVQGDEQFLDEMQKKVNKYIKQAEDVFNSEKNGITFTFAEARLKELEGGEE